MPVLELISTKYSFISNDSVSNITIEEKSDKLIAQIKNLERFCNKVIEIKLFWTTEILNFFEVPKELHANFEIERARYERLC